MAAMAKIEQAKADLTATEAGVKVAQASLQKSEQFLSFATIKAPFDGTV
jgi:multidrug resistance efflux pump